MGVVKAIKVGHMWIVRNGKHIRFWEDTWFGTSPLAVQFKKIYVICPEKSAIVSKIWNGSQLKLFFRTIFTLSMMEQW